MEARSSAPPLVLTCRRAASGYILVNGQKNTPARWRRQIVAWVRQGLTLRAAARRARVSLHTVQRWVTRAGQTRLDRVLWLDRPPIAHQVRRTARSIETRVVAVRQVLRVESDLGEFGAAAIHRALVAEGATTVPSVRTIGRILARTGALDVRRRIRRLAPPPGWYLPTVARGEAELDSFDIVEGLTLPDGTEVEVLTATSLHAHLAAAWPGPAVSARQVVTTLTTHWREVGLPTYAQFDNDNRFQGPHQHRDAVGRVIRLCLSLGIVPVFAPPREPGLQNATENFNGRWQQKVWRRFEHATLDDVRQRSARFIVACRQRARERYPTSPSRLAFPNAWHLDLQAPLRGRIIFIRRTSEHGTVTLLGHRFAVDQQWCHRLVRCELALDHRQLQFYGLRRAASDVQPLLREVAHSLPSRRFRE